MNAQDPKFSPSLESAFRRWREHALRESSPAEVAARENRLHSAVHALTNAGLAPAEAFLVALRRLGADDAGTRGFVRSQPGLLWEPEAVPAGRSFPGRETLAALGLAAGAAAAIQVPHFFGLTFGSAEYFYARNLSLLVLPFLAVLLAWRREIGGGPLAAVAVVFAAAALLVNTPPFRPSDALVTLTATHLPIALWLALGLVHAGGAWRETAARMEFVRFSGEFFIHGVLIALGGGVLIACVTMIFRAIGLDIREFIGSWLAPCGLAAAAVVAAWLADGRRGLASGMAPLLARIFTPLFTAVLVTFLATVALTGRGVTADREVLIGFDVLLAVVAGLLLYAVASRDPHAPPVFFDQLLLLLLGCALLADLLALRAIASRISDFGFSPNRVAALGENLILLVNLGWSAVLHGRFVLGRGGFGALERWQTRCLPVYAGWAALVAIIFPAVFR